MRLRPGADSDDFATLVAACWAEHPDIVVDIDAEAPELRRLASYFAARGGALWAADGASGLVGMIGAAPCDGDAWEVHRLYVAAPERGSGLGHRLLDAAEMHAAGRGARRLVLWTDTRFARAHRFYQKRGYIRTSGPRPVGDLSGTLEDGYERRVVVGAGA